MKRTFLAACLGCVALFLWAGLSHSVLLIGAGFTPLPQEEATMNALSRSVKEQGLYFFPGKDFRHSTPEQEANLVRKTQNGARGHDHLSTGWWRAFLCEQTLDTTAGQFRHGIDHFVCRVTHGGVVLGPYCCHYSSRAYGL